MIRSLVLATLLVGTLSPMAMAVALIETPSLAPLVADGTLPPVAERVPEEPAVVDLAARGQKLGRHGGTLNMVMGGVKDTRQLVVYGYARLVAYESGTFELKPDILKAV